MSQANEPRKRAIQDLAGIAFLAVCVYFGFKPLFDYVEGGVEANVVGAAFGAIFVIVLTMYLLNKQTELEQESKRGEKVFEEKIDFYKTLLNSVKEVLQDGEINAAELNQLSFAMVELQMVGADQTIKSFIPVLEKCNEVFQGSEEEVITLSDEEKIALLERLAEFSQQCRVDLGIDASDVDPEIFRATVAQISEGVTKKVGQKEFYGGIDSKLQQLRDLGYNEAGIESYRILMSFFDEKAQNNSRYRASMAKGGSGFYDANSPQKQQLYLTNPQKRSSGVGIHIKEATGLTDEVRQYVLDKLGKNHSDNVKINTEDRGKKVYDCYLHNALADEMGVEAYHDLLRHIRERIWAVCEARGS